MTENNTSLVTTNTNNSALSPAVERFNTAGKSMGYVQNFRQEGSAKNIAAALKAQGLNGTALKKRTNEILSGKADLGQQLAVAWVQSQFQSGMAVDVAKVNSKETASSLHFIRTKSIEQVEAEKNAPSKEDMDLLAALKTAGVTAETIKALLAKGA